jgi:hypothetical protein
MVADSGGILAGPTQCTDIDTASVCLTKFVGANTAILHILGIDFVLIHSKYVSNFSHAIALEEVMTKYRTSFFAYPSQPAELGRTIISACTKNSNIDSAIRVFSWAQDDVFGADIAENIRTSIMNADLFIFDITVPNLNVYFEAGFAIGAEKPALPVINHSYSNSLRQSSPEGLFDTIGHKKYENSDQLVQIFRSIQADPLADLYRKNYNHKQPIFFLDLLKKTDFRNSIVSAIKGSKNYFRSFDPVEIPRMSLVSMIAEISCSSGIIVPLLADNFDDASRHNLRAAFLAGLAEGFDRSLLMLKLVTQDQNEPTDFKNQIHFVRDEAQISEIVVEFTHRASIEIQSEGQNKRKKTTRSKLQRLALGASAAENEFRTLENYFVETAEYGRSLRGEVNVVAGRKGSGKTAIFFRVRDMRRRSSIVTDLKPDSHQLSLFREELLKIVDAGVFDHTLAAFWYYVLTSEILLQIRQQLDRGSKRDARLLNDLHEVERALQISGIEKSGDFTARINKLIRFIVQEIEAATARNEKQNPEKLTNTVFRMGIPQMRDIIVKNSDSSESIVILFDNIDKGWPANGIHDFDIRLVRLLLESLEKMKRDFATMQRDFSSIVFLRNDIYELLVETTPDRGKLGQARIDWTDRIKLRQVILRRIQSSIGDTRNFDQVWGDLFVRHIDHQDSFEYFIDHCLMRPRFLINIIEAAVANAINRGHSVVQFDDCKDAVYSNSLYLIDDFGYEIRDVSGLPQSLLYALVGSQRIATKEEIIDLLISSTNDREQAEKAFSLMLWYGIIGVLNQIGTEKYVYDYDYNMKRLEAEIRISKLPCQFAINPAIYVALS